MIFFFCATPSVSDPFIPDLNHCYHSKKRFNLYYFTVGSIFSDTKRGHPRAKLSNLHNKQGCALVTFVFVARTASQHSKHEYRIGSIQMETFSFFFCNSLSAEMGSKAVLKFLVLIFGEYAVWLYLKTTKIVRFFNKKDPNNSICNKNQSGEGCMAHTFASEQRILFCSTFKHRTAYTRNVPTIRLSLSRLKIERTRASQPSNRAKAFIRTTNVA